MATAKVVHSQDAVTVIFEGDKTKNLEPSTGIIKFPGGFVEVSRIGTKYWAHIYQDGSKPIVESRIDYNYEGYVATGGSIPDVPHADKIVHIAVKVG